jgi:molybdenum cofactor synthesis domain-containing protein
MAEKLIALGDAQRQMLDDCWTLDAVTVPIDQAIGAVLAETCRSPFPLPRFVNSQMDGYALQAADCTEAGTQLKVLRTVLAGADPGVRVAPGECVRIMTGAALPEGADAVCPLEEVEVAGDLVTIRRALSPGTFVRMPGDDLRQGAVVLGEGSVIGPIDAGLLRAVGLGRVSVIRRPRVGVLSTGDELIEEGDLEGDTQGRIFDANRTMLLGLVAESAAEAIDLGVVGDDEDLLIERILDAAASCDAIITTGGVSVGDRDIVRSSIGRLPCRTSRILRVAIKPGKPQVFAVLAGSPTAIFGLPGNPVSAAVTFELFARPALRLMAGRSDLHRPMIRAEAGDRFDRTIDGKLHVRPVTFSRGSPVVARTDGRTGSHVLSALQGIAGFALIPDGPGVAVGEALDCLVLDAEEALQATAPPAMSMPPLSAVSRP